MALPDPKTSPSPALAATSRVEVSSSHPVSVDHPEIGTYHSPPLPAQKHAGRRKWPWVVGLILFAVAAAFGIPWFVRSLSTVSTDDAYVNGHVTLVAPRVTGQVKEVLVDDNNSVRKGD